MCRIRTGSVRNNATVQLGSKPGARCTKLASELEWGHEKFRIKRNRGASASGTVRHGGQALSPSALTRFGEIPKRTFGDRQTLEIREYRQARRWREAVPNSARIHQIAYLVISDQDRIKGCRARNVSTDHRFRAPQDFNRRGEGQATGRPTSRASPRESQRCRHENPCCIQDEARIEDARNRSTTTRPVQPGVHTLHLPTPFRLAVLRRTRRASSLRSTAIHFRPCRTARSR